MTSGDHWEGVKGECEEERGRKITRVRETKEDKVGENEEGGGNETMGKERGWREREKEEMRERKGDRRGDRGRYGEREREKLGGKDFEEEFEEQEGRGERKNR